MRDRASAMVPTWVKRAGSAQTFAAVIGWSSPLRLTACIVRQAEQRTHEYLPDGDRGAVNPPAALNKRPGELNFSSEGASKGLLRRRLLATVVCTEESALDLCRDLYEPFLGAFCPAVIVPDILLELTKLVFGCKKSSSEVSHLLALRLSYSSRLLHHAQKRLPGSIQWIGDRNALLRPGSERDHRFRRV